jgi:hypothetical protein
MESLLKRPKRRSMVMKLWTGNVRDMYRAGSLIRASKELSIYKLNYWECRRSDGRAVAPLQQKSTHFSAERGMKVIFWVQVSLYIRE